MIMHIPQEEILKHWDVLSEELDKFWDVGINYETLPNLKKRLLADFCKLWLWTSSDGEGRFLFVTEDKVTATARILTVTHTAGTNRSGKPWGARKIRSLIGVIFEEIEDMALTLYYDAVCIHARPAHVKMARDYEVMSVPIVKQLTHNNKRGK